METGGAEDCIISEELELYVHGKIVDMLNNKRHRYIVAYQNPLKKVIYE